MNVGNRSHRLGWMDENDLPAQFFSETAAGSLGIPEDQGVGTDWDSWYFTIPGVFNRTDVIKNAGGGKIQVMQAGLYMLNAYITTANNASAAQTNIRFVRNSTEVIANSTHQIYEAATNNDRDMIAKGVPVVLAADDIVECQVQSNVSNHGIEALSNWMIRLCTGLSGAVGAVGTYTPPDPLEFYAYRDAQMGADRNIQGVWKNAFEDADLSIHAAERYDAGSEFNTTTALWTPSEGYYNVSGCVSSTNITDTAFVEACLYNVTGGVEQNWGFKGRNEDNSGQCYSNFNCQIYADGATTYGLYARAINDTGIQIIGEGGGYSTFLTAHRFKA